MPEFCPNLGGLCNAGNEWATPVTYPFLAAAEKTLGGRILADWPGLSASALYEGRDLRPTTDLRSVFKTVLRDHLAVPQPHIESQVFPDSKAAPYVADLMRNASA